MIMGNGVRGVYFGGSILVYSSNSRFVLFIPGLGECSSMKASTTSLNLPHRRGRTKVRRRRPGLALGAPHTVHTYSGCSLLADDCVADSLAQAWPSGHPKQGRTEHR